VASSNADASSETTHEQGVVRSFVAEAKRDRYLQLLGNRRRRSTFLHALADRRDFDARFAVAIPRKEQTAAGVATLLRRRGAPDTCYVLSEIEELDGRILPLSEALSASFGMGLGTVLSCIPGTLAYFEGEAPGDRVILERGSGPTRRCS
jgi:hypothetical protein